MLQLTNDSGSGIEDASWLWIDDWSRLTTHNGNVIQNDFGLYNVYKMQHWDGLYVNL